MNILYYLHYNPEISVYESNNVVLSSDGRISVDIPVGVNCFGFPRVSTNILSSLLYVSNTRILSVSAQNGTKVAMAVLWTHEMRYKKDGLPTSLFNNAVLFMFTMAARNFDTDPPQLTTNPRRVIHYDMLTGEPVDFSTR